jgi:putative ABC transport system permease protein
MSAWLRDLRYAARALRANGAFTVAALATMTVAIAATTSVFSIMNAVLLQPLPIAGAARVVAIGTATKDAPAAMMTTSLEEIEEWRRQSSTVAAFGAWRDWGMLRYDGTRRANVYGIVATPALFDVLAMRPVLGRGFTPADDERGAAGVALLGYRYWQQEFGGDPDVLGKTLDLERGPRALYTIVGVLPPSFNEMPSFDRVLVVLPSGADPDARSGWTRRNRFVFGRLRDGVSIAAARVELEGIADRLAKAYPATNSGRLVRVIPAIDYEVGAMADTIRAFFAAVGLVLLIAAANVAGLQLARAVSRRREFSIRRALGSTRGALVRALVCETALLSLVAGIAGLMLSGWLVELVLTRGPALPRAASVPFDGRVFAFTLALCVASSLILALPAALLSTRVPVAQVLKEQATQVPGAALRARTMFVGAQAALALMLLVGAASAASALVHQLSVRPGFDPDGLAWMTLRPPMARYPKATAVAALYDRAIEAARAVPGVAAASAVSATPLSGAGPEPEEFTVDGMQSTTPARPAANTFNVAAGYFRTLGASLIRGRDFEPGDGPAAPQVAVVNDTFVRRYLADRDPLKTTLRIGSGAEAVHIVGVVPDLLQEITPRAAAQPEIYFPYSQRARWATYLVLRAERHPATAIAAVRERIAAVDPEVRTGTPVMMTDRVQQSARGPKFVTLLLGAFAAIAVLLSATGIAGLVLYTTAQRSREIAVRVSLGATPPDVVRLVGKGAFLAVTAGSAVGVAGAMALSRVLASTLRDLDPVGPGLALAAALLFVAVGALASYLPARRAALTDPAAVMRSA